MQNLPPIDYDPDAKRLAKAIRQVETGNRPVAGATGELKSRYQFMPATWREGAKKYLGDENAPLTLENENRVAYSKIKEWKDKGYTPNQIASMWNSGKPDAYKQNYRGVSSTNPNVRYDVPAYVEKVRKAYVGLKQSEGIAKPQTVEPTAEEPKRSVQVGGSGVAGNALNALAGFGKGVISTLTGLSSLGQRGAAAIGIPLAKGINVNGQTIGGFRGGQSSAQQLIPEAYRKPEGLAQKVGFGTEQVAEFFVPGGASGKVGKAAAGARLVSRLPKAAQKLVPLAARGAAEAGLASGQVSAQRGTTEGFGTAAAIGGSIPFAGAALRGGTRLIGRAITESLGKSTGVGAAALREVADNPKAIEFAREAGASGVDGLQQRALQEATAALRLMAQRRGAAYERELEKIGIGEKVGKYRVVQPLDDALEAIKSEAADQAKRYGVAVSNGAADFSGSTLIEKQNVIGRAIEDVSRWDDATPLGLDTLKKRLSTYVEQAEPRSPARSFLTSLKQSVDQRLKAGVPGYEAMTKKYHEASNLIDEIESSLSLGSKRSMDTAVRKLMSVFRQNNETRKDLLQALEQVSGSDIAGKLAGASVAPLVPRGLAGTLFPGGALFGGFQAVSNPRSWPLILTYLAASSPRLVGEFMNVVGKAGRTKDGLLEMAPSIRTQLGRIFGEAERRLPKKLDGGLVGGTGINPR